MRCGRPAIPRLSFCFIHPERGWYDQFRCRDGGFLWAGEGGGHPVACCAMWTAEATSRAAAWALCGARTVFVLGHCVADLN